MSINRSPAWGEFVRSFNRIAAHRHRYEVFRDFVTMAAIAMHNAIRKKASLEDEYLKIVKCYERDQVTELCGLFSKLVVLLEGEPQDVLGPLYMELELGNNQAGQFFTPHEISELLARMTYGDELKSLKKPFITLSEPACGAGGMVLAFVKVMISHGHDPAKRLWVQCQDVDRTAALMCYLQLSLWNVPAAVIVGNTLSMEVREVFYTPAHYLGLWEYRLRRRDDEEVTHCSHVLNMSLSLRFIHSFIAFVRSSGPIAPILACTSATESFSHWNSTICQYPFADAASAETAGLAGDNGTVWEFATEKENNPINTVAAITALIGLLNRARMVEKNHENKACTSAATVGGAA